ncbi:MAG: FadR family transcriptional regulator [Caulobacteraceae bacterium]|nr:FadR family transcriptional regulator [Caulobacteraceae bacterium]
MSNQRVRTQLLARNSFDEKDARPRPKLAEMVAMAITDEIAKLGWPVGRNIGRLPDLTRRYGVSESIAREAVRQLEQNGLVRMLRGDKPGLVVSSPPPAVAAQALVTYLHLVDVKPTEVLGFAHAFEHQMAMLCAQRLSSRAVPALRGSVDRLMAEHDLIKRMPVFRDLMRQLTAATTNPLFSMFCEVVFQSMGSLGMGGGEGPEMERIQAQGDLAMRAWCIVAEAVIAGDLQGISRTLNAFGDGEEFDQFTSSYRRLVRTGSAPIVNPETFDMIFGPLHKRSLFLAFQIAGQLNDEGAQEGVNLGREPQLTARYGVSRGVFREAARILELHQICKTRRGNAGGMYTGRPSPAYAIQTARTCLHYLSISTAQVCEARLAFEPAAARKVAEETPELARRLRAILDGEGPASERLEAFHAHVMSAAANRVVALVSEALVSCEGLGEEVCDSAVAAARIVADAIGAGDGALSARSMIEFISAWAAADRQDWTLNTQTFSSIAPVASESWAGR